ncbi:bifunctional 4-hydroxy-2-oxoglutarate aldolase/2-dehydro-3-deoxy-phosphogluconate aldolase [Leucobacter sp.]
MHQTAQSTRERVNGVGVVAVLRAPSADHAVEAARAVVEGGILGIEVTYSTPGAAEAIRRLVDELGDRAVVGAGTVTEPEQAAEAVAAGAAFLVSPGATPRVAEAMRATGAVTMLGALTPSEVMSVSDFGADIVKLFPGSLGGPRYLAGLRGPFPGLPFMPTGGVNAGNIGDWVRAGAVAVGVGGELVSAADYVSGDYSAVRERARELAAAWGRAQEGEAA